MQILDENIQAKVKRISPVKTLTRKVLLYLAEHPSSLQELREHYKYYSQNALNISLSELKHKHLVELVDGKLRVAD